MDFPQKILIVALLCILSVVVNLPFGYFRKRSKKFSFRWLLCIHLPITFIILARIISNVDFKYIPLFLLAAFIGQFIGGKMEF